MSFKGISDETEACSPSILTKNSEDLCDSYNVGIEENQSENEEPDVTVPIIEIQCEDSDDQKKFSKVNVEADENSKSNNSSGLVINGDAEATLSQDSVKSESKIPSNETLPYLVNFVLEEGGNNQAHEVFRCDLCGAGFRIKHSITKHKRVVHGMHQFVCMFCKNSYPLKRNLLEHIATHKGPHGFKCGVCNKVRPNYVSIQRHVKTHAQKNIPCVKCGAWFKTKWELKSHEIQHKEDRQFNCGTCGRTFINPTKLREHMTQHLGERPFKCDICGKDFNAQGNLTNHRKLHFDEKPFKCQYCSLSFLTNSARKKHIPVHEREKRKPYQCQDCNKKYTSTTSLAVHRMKFHSGGRVFHCHYCKQKFKSKSDIAEHVAEHAAERPHSCQHCLCRYKNKRELRRHQREKEHYDTQARENERPLPYRTTIGPIDPAMSDSVPLDEEEDDELENEDWEMPEPEVCIKVADSDEENGGILAAGCTRRVAPPITLPATLEDPAASWKGPPPGSEPQNFAPNSGQNFSGPPAGFQGPSPFQGPPGGAGSPAGGPPYGGPPPGSGTPQYTASPAPSGSSTPGPPQPNSGFPGPPPNSGGPPFNGPGHGPFGSPSGGSQFIGRPGSSGPQFIGGPPGGGNPHFSSPGHQPFGGPGFGLPPGSPFGHGPGHPMPGPMPSHGMMPGMPGPSPVDRIDHGSLPVPRRHTPYFGQPDYRIYELNKRLQQRTEESDNLWWDAFATEFFEDDAQLTLAFCLEDGPKRYTIGRTLIPRYFRSIFEGGVTELYYNLKHPKESFHNTSITLDCEQCSMITHHGKPMFTKVDFVCTEGRLILEFTFDDLMRIKTWHFSVRTHRELIPRSVVGMHSAQDPSMLEQLSKNITRQGITSSTLNYLRLCVILEPMQELMSRHKAYALSPRDCLKTTLFQKWQRMVAPPESQRPANKRRKRKGSNSAAVNNTAPVPNKKRSPGPNFSLASQDVMVVGEPSLMGGEFGDEDERLITRLENTQYDAANSLDHDNHGFSDSPMTGGPNSWGGGPDRGPIGPPQGNTPSSQDSDKKSPAVSQ